MAKIELTPADFKAGMPLDLGWYRATVKEFKKELNKNKDGINYVPTFIVIDDAGNERQLQMWITPKMKSQFGLKMGRLIAALEGQILDPKNPLEFDDERLDSYVGKELWVRAVPTPSGIFQNEIDNFLPAQVEEPNKVPF